MKRMKINLNEMFDDQDDEQVARYPKRKMPNNSNVGKVEKIVKTKKRPDRNLYRKNKDVDNEDYF